MKQDEFKKRSDNIELLEKYSNWLMKNGYLDTDWQSEPPYAIDEFLKTLPKNLLSKKPSVSDEEINNIIRTRIQELKRDNDNNYLEYDMVEKDMPEQLEAIRKMIKDALSLPPQVVQSEVSDDVNIVLDNKHEINYNITPPDAEKELKEITESDENELSNIIGSLAVENFLKSLQGKGIYMIKITDAVLALDFLKSKGYKTK